LVFRKIPGTTHLAGVVELSQCLFETVLELNQMIDAIEESHWLFDTHLIAKPPTIIPDSSIYILSIIFQGTMVWPRSSKEIVTFRNEEIETKESWDVFGTICIYTVSQNMR
jgi:hypothetical protein